MENKVKVSLKLKTASIGMILIGVLALIMAFMQDAGRAWANILLNNYTFLSIVIGATFFIAIQYITQSGWSAMFKRVPEAISGFMPIIGLLMLVMIFGVPYLYEWSHEDMRNSHEIIQHKSPYLNTIFFIIRMILFLSLWMLIIFKFRKFSLKEDEIVGMEFFNKSEFLSKVFIFVMAITFSLGTFDWVMSVDVTWFSTVYAFKNIASAFYHAAAVIIVVVLLLKNLGYFPKMNKFHLQDFSRYLFALSILWAYLWFIEYLLIWFANIPEETSYYVQRREGNWNTMFYLDIFINFIIPFLLLLPIQFDRNKYILFFVAGLLIFGQWITNFIQIMPGTIHDFHIGFFEIGIYMGYLGLFILVVSQNLSKAPIIPKNHPFLLESEQHHF
ncbi:MAG: hypothetical protein CO118_05720 [Flavobacteriales bacterium CG_4_9_14_3_um_filter_32_8]|nr:MAG: hypothetical protein CO118_05720 [Flavobacteriales bacterium CG_4_9_14_3_um_filter_32_8]